MPDVEQRQAATSALKNWLSSQFDAAAQIFEQKLVQTGDPVEATVAEQAVDKVMKRAEWMKPALPAGF